MEDTRLFLVNFIYDDPEDSAHEIYEVPESRILDAHRCVAEAYNKWKDESNEATPIQPFIESAFRENGIAFKTRSYSATDINLDQY